MPFVSVPKDLDKVKTKVALNLTKRQLVCFSTAVAIGIPLYFCSKKIIGNETAVLCMVAVMLPFFFIAMYEKDGLPMEKILWNIIRSQILCPRIRPYSTNNLYSVLLKEGIYENKKTNPTRNEITKYKTKTKKNEFMEFLGTWMHLEDIILSEIIQSQKK